MIWRKGGPFFTFTNTSKPNLNNARESFIMGGLFYQTLPIARVAGYRRVIQKYHNYSYIVRASEVG